MARFEDLYFNSSNGNNIIRARKCCPDGDVRAVVQISHGIAEYIDRYEDFMLFLADNGIASIERDKEGKLWISTDHGLCCHDPKTGLTQSFFVDNGLQSNEFSDGASCVVDRGDRVVLIFGGGGGITWFHPERIKQVKWDARVSSVMSAFHVSMCLRSWRSHPCGGRKRLLRI